ncbi:hypothetical protein ACSBR2_025128 [Camellia fascicularis]
MQLNVRDDANEVCITMRVGRVHNNAALHAHLNECAALSRSLGRDNFVVSEPGYNFKGWRLLVDLTVLDMRDFDIILGMDWLATSYAFVDCRGKMVVFQIPIQPEFCFVGSGVNTPLLVISALQARRLLRNGCEGYLASMRDTRETELKLEDILVVKEFPDVFPEELLVCMPNSALNNRALHCSNLSNNFPSINLLPTLTVILSESFLTRRWSRGRRVLIVAHGMGSSDNNTSQVIGLDLSCSWLLGTIHPNTTIFYYFPHLQSLNLAFNDFGMSRISSEFCRFTRLTHLNLSDSSFSGKVPIEVSFLSKLISLDLSYNYGLRLEEPGFELLVQNLTKLRELNLFDVNISSVVSNSLLNLTSLTLLDLSFCGLRGKFPDGIFHLPHLNELRILYNLALTGYFPEFMNSSSPLQYLVLTGTNFSGELPDSIGNLKSLKKFYAAACKFYGSIPTSLGNLTEMIRLAIAYNNFTGMLPSSLSNLGNLVKLGVQSNNFEGKIADFLPNAKSLIYLYVGSNNFSGPFPSLVANLTSLVELDLSNNQLTGPLPSWVFSLPVLYYFNLSNNKLTGHVKEFKSTDLVVIDLSNNSLYGRFPSSTFKLANLTSLILSSNNFSGELDMLCHAVSLQLLDLSSNSFDGSIPQCFGNFSTYFSVLDLRENNFSGTIPNTFVKGNSFEIINLNGNGFEGTVPKSLANCKMLRVVDLGCNKFSDKFPFWLEKLRWLQVLILRSNKFHGPMPASKAKFPFLNLRVMDLSDNYFTGPLPKTYFKTFNAMMNVVEVNFKLQYIEKSVVGSMFMYPYHYHDCLIMVI